MRRTGTIVVHRRVPPAYADVIVMHDMIITITHQVTHQARLN